MISLFERNEDNILLRGFKHQGDSNRKVILFQHGYFSANCSGPNRLFYCIAKMGLIRNFDSVRIDMIGTGLSDGKLSDSRYIGNLEAYKNILYELSNVYDEIILIGHSMGTSYTLELSNHPKVVSSILISPSFGLIDNIDILFNKRQKEELKINGYTDRKGLIVSQDFLIESQNVEIKNYKTKLKKPLTFIYGSNDELYKKESLMEFVSGWNKSKNYEISEADHNFIELIPRLKLLEIVIHCLEKI